VSDWRSGDLALCVRNKTGSSVQSGAVLMVVAVRPARDGFQDAGQTLLFFEGHRSGGVSGGFWTNRFRKIAAHLPDTDDAETIRLLNSALAPKSAQ